MGYVRRVETDVASDLWCPLSHLNQIWRVSIKFIINVACKAYENSFSFSQVICLQTDKPTNHVETKNLFPLQFFIPNSSKMGLKCGLERTINPLY